MGKKISATVFLLMALLISLNAYAQIITRSSISFGPRQNGAVANPFHILIRVYLLFPTSKAVIKVNIPKGIQLLEGDTKWSGGIEKCEKTMDLLVQVDKPGIYEVTGTCNVKDLTKQRENEKFPLQASIFFYATTDTLLWRLTRQEIDEAIQDSLGYPEVVSRRSYDRSDSSRWIRNAQQNGPIYTSFTDLANLAYILPLYPLYYVFYAKALSDSFDTSEVDVIEKYHLVYSPPRYDWIEHRLAMDLLKRNTKEVICSLPKEQLQNLSKHISENMTLLYNLDQQIIKLKSSGEQAKLLKDRDAFLANEMKERKALLQPEPPVTR